MVQRLSAGRHDAMHLPRRSVRPQACGGDHVKLSLRVLPERTNEPMNPAIRAAVDASRLHHQWFPDEARFEGTREHPETVQALKKMGHQVAGGKQGDAHSIWIDPKTGLFYGAEDKRLSGKTAGY